MKKKISVLASILTLCFLYYGLSGCDTTTPTQNEVTVSPIFDVPTLVRKNIDEIRKVLGKPIDNDMEPSKVQMKTTGFDEWDNSFEKRGYTLIVTFNPKNRKVIDFFVTNDEGSFTDISLLNKISNVKEGSTDYRLELVKQISDNSKYTGLKIIPN